MNRFLVVMAICVATFTLNNPTAQADVLQRITSRPIRVINRAVPMLDLSTAVPSVREITNVPLPRWGNVPGYPRQVLRYGFRVHPGARIARRNGLMLFDF